MKKQEVIKSFTVNKLNDMMLDIKSCVNINSLSEDIDKEVLDELVEIRIRMKKLSKKLSKK